MIEIAPIEYWITDLNWYDAKFYCFSLDVNGKTGWSLPSVDCFVFESSKVLKGARKYERTWYWTSVENNDTHALQLSVLDFGTIEWYKLDTEIVTMPVRYMKDA